MKAAKKELTVRDHVEVWLDASFLPEMQLVGTLSHDRGHYYFEYSDSWLKNKLSFNIDPALVMYPGEQTAIERFGIFTDSAPDRWGRVLMDRRERVDAKQEGRTRRSLMEWDYLQGVQDLTRMGAIRLKKEGAYIDASELGAPPVTSLQELQEVARLLDQDDDSELPELKRWLTTLIDPGSSLGGARPKANFLNSDQSLWIAKFPKSDDKVDVGLWEGVTMELAKMAGIDVPDYAVQRIAGDHHTFLVKRFDRTDGRREMFVSAMTMLQKKDGEGANSSYLEIAEFLQDEGRSGIRNEMKTLWRRMVFNVMASNRDDHLRNHGFIRNAEGWGLSPAYDMNPNRDKLEHSINLSFDSPEPTFENLFEGVPYLRLQHEEAAAIAIEVHEALQHWRTVAKRMGVKNQHIEDMETVFALADAPLTLPAKPGAVKHPQKALSKQRLHSPGVAKGLTQDLPKP